MRSFGLALFGVVTVLCAPAMSVRAQVVSEQYAQGGPRFLYALPGAAQPSEIDAASVPMLRRRITLKLDGVELRKALAAIATAAGMELVYSDDVIPATGRVRLVAERITVAAALTEALLDASIDVVLSPNGSAALVRRTAPKVPAFGTITGRVTDSSTTQAVWQAKVSVQGTKLSTSTDAEGRFTIRQVPVGDRVVSVKFVGYTPATRSVSVVENEMATVTFFLIRSPTELNKVVTTATGEQRERELGHVVNRINADSLVKEAPITTMTDLLQSRVPGLQVLTGNGGMAGGEVSFRLRGTSTYRLDPEPIVIVDGVRYKSNNLVQEGSAVREDRRGAGGAELQSPLNDLNPNDIETIEVVQGPSASTLYGPDAANGVILITTKRGVAGETRFQWYVRPVANEVPRSSIDKAYRAWGHDASGALFGGNCTLMSQYFDQSCTLDSVTVTRATVSNDQYSVIAKTRPTWQYGSNVSGGSQTFRYFVSGNYNSQVGVLQIPPAAQTFLKKQLGVTALSDAIRNPNTLQVASLHSNVSKDIGSHFSVSTSVNYARTNHRTIDASVFADQVSHGTPQPTQDTTLITAYLDPTFSLLTTEEHSNHFTGAVNGTARFSSWLSANASMGLDLDGTVTHAVLPSDEQYVGSLGYAIDDRRDHTGITLNAITTAMARPGILSFRSSIGAQYSYDHLDGLRSSGYGLAPGSMSIGTAAYKSVDQLWSETVSLGTFGEEVVGVNDRIFLTGSLRLDGSTSFGDAYKPRPYPKVGFSWIASEEPFLKGTPGLRLLRFRGSYGASSRYPTSEMKLGRIDGYGATVQGSTQNIFDRGELANPMIRPERTRESEYGADVTVLWNVDVRLTWYNRRTNDQLQPFGNNNSGLPQYWANIASLKSHGVEATVNVPVINAVGIRAEVAFAYSNRVEKVLSLGAGVDNRTYDGSGYAVGYPIGSMFGYPILGVADTVSGHADGIVLPQEVIRDTVQRFLGVVVPPRTYTATPTLTFLNGRLRLSALFDRETGFLRYNGYGSPLDQFLPSTPLIRQARYARQYNGEDFLEPGDFTRWREMNVTVELPQRFLRIDPLHLAFSRGAVSLQGRNLAIWTKYHGSDPESQDRAWSGNSTANGIPQARAWSIRFDITP